ncbi:MAG TPA: hypothetical protein VK901_00685 [Nitrospiraceae bacterium]|nr:hypothetical protein [Nitrospiraceae bacterium]
MVSIPKIVGVMSCGFVLCLILSNTTQATDRMAPDPCADRKGGQPNLVKCDEETLQGIDTINGELLRVEHESYFIKKNDGKEVVLHVDGTTQMYGNIRQGDKIEAKIKRNNVDDQKHTVSMRQAK